MPINYSNYPHDWKTRIRPEILAREENKCKFCKVPNGTFVFRGFWNGLAVWQNTAGKIYNARTGEFVDESYIGDVLVGKKKGMTKIVLTIMHLDHDTKNNEYSNLAAACQRCHLIYDKEYHKKNAKATRTKKKGLRSLFDE